MTNLFSRLGMHEGAAAPSHSIRSGGMYAARSGPGGRFLYHFLAAAEGSKGGRALARLGPRTLRRKSAGPYPEPSIGRIRATKENDATQENEAFIFLTACRLFRHAEGFRFFGRNPWGSLRLHGHMEGAGDDFALLSLGKLVEIDRVARYPDGQAGIFLRVVVGVQQ